MALELLAMINESRTNNRAAGVVGILFISNPFSDEFVSCGELLLGFYGDGARPSVMDGSTTRRVAPTRAFVTAIFDDARNGWVAAGKAEHLGATCAVVLRVVVDERDAFRVIEISCLLAVGTVRFCVDNQGQVVFTSEVISLAMRQDRCETRKGLWELQCQHDAKTVYSAR